MSGSFREKSLAFWQKARLLSTSIVLYYYMQISEVVKIFIKITWTFPLLEKSLVWKTIQGPPSILSPVFRFSVL